MLCAACGDARLLDFATQSVALGAAVGLQLYGKLWRVGLEISPVLALRRNPRPRPDPVSFSCTVRVLKDWALPAATREVVGRLRRMRDVPRHIA